jgi:hypothetical protein
VFHLGVERLVGVMNLGLDEGTWDLLDQRGGVGCSPQEVYRGRQCSWNMARDTG